MNETLDWNDLRLFLAVARGGGLARGAKAVRASAPTLGRRIMALERALGVQLFERSKSCLAHANLGPISSKRLPLFQFSNDSTDLVALAACPSILHYIGHQRSRREAFETANIRRIDCSQLTICCNNL